MHNKAVNSARGVFKAA